MPAFRFLTAGESHGPALGATIEGVPAGLPLTEDDLAVDLARRQRGYGRGARQAIEQDRAEILAGVRHGRTLGSPILLLIRNRDWENWTRVMQVAPLTDAEADELLAAADDGNKRATPVTRVRPGHADLAGALKYGFNDVRNVLERASARETAARVAAGGVARAFLRELGHRGLVVHAPRSAASPSIRRNAPARATRPTRRRSAARTRTPRSAMIARIDEARSAGDTIGGVFEVVVHGLPIGLGSYVHWDRRLDAALAAAVMSINIVKGVEFGLGFEQTRRFGSAVHDVIEGRERRRSLGPPDEQRGRADRRRDQRRAARRPRRGQADLDAGPAAAVGRPRDRRAGRQGALRAQRHQRRAGGRRRRRGDGHAHAGRGGHSTSSAATRSRTSARTSRPTGRGSSGRPRRRWPAAVDRRGRDRPTGRPRRVEAHGLTGTDEAGSGGDD